MTAKPASLPAVGTILKSYTSSEVIGAAPGSKGGAGGVITRAWKLEVKFGGYFSYQPSNGSENSGSSYSAPSVNSNFKYNNELWVKNPGDAAFRAIPLPASSGPFKANQPFVWSSSSPQTLYGWKPAGSTTTTTTSTTKKVTTKKSTTKAKPSTSGGTTASAATMKKSPTGAVVANPPLHAHSNPVWKYDQTGKSNLSRLGLITLPTDIRDIAGVKYTKRWGFRFLYNPSNWGYSQAYKEDITMPEQVAGSDVALMIPGTTSYQFEIYLNRIPDMKTANQAAKFYPAGTSLTELQQIWERGTEYDLDYLYRVLNGDPKQVVGWKKSANIGVIAPARVLVTLGAALHMTANVSSISVTHKMMTATMIPTFTSVSIGLTQWYQEYK